jgi:hypothetical protein
MIKKTKVVLLSSLFLCSSVVCLAALQNDNHLFAVANIESIGNHYLETAQTASSAGTKEYWVSCNSHSHYLSTKNIPDYNPEQWEDAGQAPVLGSEYVNDNRYLKDIFGTPIVKEGSGFSADASKSKLYASDQEGWILTGNDFYNFSFDFVDNSAGTVDSFGTHDIDNAILFGANYTNGNLTGYALTVSWDYVGLFYLTGDKDTFHTAGDCIIRSWTAQGYAGRTINVSVINSQLFVSCEGTLLLSSWLSPVDWDPGLYPAHTYTGGKIGFLNTQKKGASDANVTISNFKEAKNVFTNVKWNNGNTWSVNEDGSQVTSVANEAGYIVTNNSYTNFRAVVTPNSTVSENIYGDHRTYNSFVFGSSVDSDGHLNGYVIEFQDSFIELAKLNGDGTNGTGNVLAFIEKNSANQDVFIEMNNKTVTFGVRKSGDYDGQQPQGFYLTQSYELNDYVGGGLGYYSNHGNAHSAIARFVA